jgi:O-antigen/teichoic acid export membrane protein
MIDRHDNLIGRIKRGLGAQSVFQIAQIFTRLAEVPLLLGFWGPRLYGEWLMLFAISAYFSMADGGFSSVASREMAMRGGAQDRAGALAVFQSTWVLLLIVSIAFFLCALPVVQFLPLTDWLDFQAIDEASTKLILLILVLHVLTGFQGGLIGGGYWSAGNYPRAMMRGAFSQLLEFSGLAVGVLSGGGPVAAAAGCLGGRLLGTLVMWRGLRQATPWLRPGFAQASLSEIKRMTRPAVASLAFPLGGALNIQGMWLVVGLVLGPEMVTVFAPIRTLTRFAMQPAVMITRVIEPEMGTAFGRGNSELFTRLFVRSSQVSVWLCLAGSLVLAVAGNWLLPLWTAGKVVMHWPLFLLLLATAAMNAIWNTVLMVPYATNRHQRIAVSYSAVYGGGAFLFSYLGAVFLGVNGVGGALLLIDIVISLYVFSIALKLSGQRWSEWLRALMEPPVFVFRHGLMKPNLERS